VESGTPPEPGLHYDSPALSWDEGLPLGNGIMGALVWGDGGPLNISLNRTDLWDLRPVEEFQGADYTAAQLRRWREAGEAEKVGRLYDDPYMKHPGPSKIPAGRLVWQLDGAPKFASAALDFQTATARVDFDDGTRVTVLVHATEPVGSILVQGSAVPGFRLLAPAFGGSGQPGARDDVVDGDDLARLGYPAPEESSGANWQAFTQAGYGGFGFAVHVGWRESGDGCVVCWSIASSFETQSPLELARSRVETALERGWTGDPAGHRAWWAMYWSRSGLRVPDPVLERQWYLAQYLFGSGSRRGAPPLTLQGPWNADNGKLPPWKGDYHHDLNTQATHWACYSGNRLEEGLSFLDWLWATRPECLVWTREYWEAPGLNVPGVADLKNRALGGWPQYSFSSTTACWLSWHFYTHWRYSRDREFLRERAYPYLRDAAIFIEAITREKDARGRRTLPLSSSPETNDNRLDAWFPAITNHDLALIRWLLGACAELCDEMGESEEGERWLQVLGEMPELARAEDGGLLLAEGIPQRDSQRHLAHTMAIHPLGLINWDDGEEAQRTILASLAELERLGPEEWVGFSYAWLAILQALARQGERAAKSLAIFATAFTLRNGFHCNGDQSGLRYCQSTYRPFTLEANFMAAAGLQMMLLQSQGGVMRIFPAVPEDWADVSFENLRADGAFLVSAGRKDGITQWIKIVAEQGGTCRFIWPFSEDEINFRMEAGEEFLIEEGV